MRPIDPWLQILNALRSLDDSVDVRIRQLIQDNGLGGKDNSPTDIIRITTSLPSDLESAVRQSLTAKIVEPVSNGQYFRDFSDTISRVTRYLQTQLAAVLENPPSDIAEVFKAYHDALQIVLHPRIRSEDAQEFLVQHWIMAPIFQDLFPGDILVSGPVSAAFERITHVFQAFLDRERQALKDFYENVRNRAQGLRDDAERQDFVRYLFEQLFKSAFPDAADRLGIVYTPVELVDFVVHSIDELLTHHFGKKTADSQVTVIDPFAGTGTFPARLLAQWDENTVKRKIAGKELWANDVQLFAYYVLLTNIQWQTQAKTGETVPHHTLPILWTDSFQLQEEHESWRTEFFDTDYTALMATQREAAITVVMGNPPWRAGQRSANDANQNLRYGHLDRRIAETYVARTTTTNKNSLYDAYIRAFRWASDRIGTQGVIGFVTNAGWIDGNAMDGFRKTLTEEFSTVYVMNLRGDVRGAIRAHDREGAKQEGESVFEIQAAAALVLLVKDSTHTGPADIFYYDIGDYLSREDKLARVKAFGDIHGVPWQPIVPNAVGDWINQRSTAFETLLPLGNKKAPNEVVVFTLYSRGVETSRDAWAYNFSRSGVEDQMRRMIAFYHTQLGRPESKQDNDPRAISWSSSLRPYATSRRAASVRDEAIRRALYRPFTKQWLYFLEFRTLKIRYFEAPIIPRALGIRYFFRFPLWPFRRTD